MTGEDRFEPTRRLVSQLDLDRDAHAVDLDAEVGPVLPSVLSPDHRDQPLRASAGLAIADPRAVAKRRQRRYPRHRARVTQTGAVRRAGADIAAIAGDRATTGSGDRDDAATAVERPDHETLARKPIDMRVGRASTEPHRQTERLDARDIEPLEPPQALHAAMPRPARP